MGIVETIFQSATVLVALAGAYVVAFWFVLIVWTYRDIESRSRNVVTQVFSTLLVVLFFVPGVLLYLILRPKDTLDQAFQRSLEEEYLLQDLEELPLCPSCHRYVEDDFVVCPNCHAQLREPCPSCSRLVDLRWAMCPYCAAVQGGRVQVVEQVEAPAARWTAPERRRRRQVASQPEALPVEDDAPAVAAGVASQTSTAAADAVGPAATGTQETRALPFTLVSGMRSIVRSTERSRRSNNGDDPGVTSANGARNGNGNGTREPLGSRMNDGSTSGDGENVAGFGTNGHTANGHGVHGAAVGDDQILAEVDEVPIPASGTPTKR